MLLLLLLCCCAVAVVVILQGLAMNFDWYQERTKDESATIGGFATALGYDFGLPGMTHTHARE